jgi:adenine-specific DNA-methyltransferase
MAQIQFKGKSFVQNHHLLVKYHELIPKKDKSITDKVSLHDNVIIHGDNLKALKALLPLYAGKIKCIYIDPPYNTGNEKWAYNDNVNSPMMQEWLGKIVDREDLTRHDKWLCMMVPRLKLLYELLAEDGVIFVSIDDNEVHRLRETMDEVFGEGNFVGTFVWKRRASSALAEKLVSVDHEYVLAYHRGGMTNFAGVAKTFGAYSNPDNDPNGDWTFGDLTVGMTKEQRPNQFYDLVDPKTGQRFKANPNRVWAFIPETMAKEIVEGRVMFPDKRGARPMVKRYRKNLKSDVNPVSTWIRGFSDPNDEEEITPLYSGLTSEGGKLLQEIFGTVPFNYSKPPSLLASLIEQVVPKSGLVLDSFAGSGTTAHAVLALNKEDGGSRKFILVECEDYADKITAERVRRVIKGVPKAKDENLKKGLGGTFSYFELGKAIELESILSGDRLPTYKELARYIFYTATGEEFDPKKLNEKKNFVGESTNYKVYLFYEPDIEKLKDIALTLERAKYIGKPGKKRRLVFAPTKYLDQVHLDELRIDFAQLPFEIYELAR